MLVTCFALSTAAEVPAREEWLPVWMQASRQAQAALAKLSNFTCVQETQRVTQAFRKRPFSDSLQLEIGIINGREVYGWPGQDLKAETPAELAAFGVFMTGGLYGHLKSIVAERHVVITAVEYLPDTEDWVFQARAASLSSGLHVGSTGGAAVDYQAKVKVNPRRCVTEMEVSFTGAPVESRIRNGRIWFGYGCRWGDFDAAPTKVLASVDRWDGSHVTTESRWRDCAKFSAEAKIVGDADAAPLNASSIPSQWTTVSTEKFATELRESASLSELKTGATVPLVLRQPVQLHDGRQLPKGTAVTARVVGVTPVENSRKSLLAIRLESFVDSTHRVSFRAKCLHIRGAKGPEKRDSGFARLVMSSALSVPLAAEDVVVVGNHSDALVVADAADWRLPAGVVFEWENVAPVTEGAR